MSSMLSAEAKSWRIYFNAHADYPLVWSVDEGTPETERKVARVHIMTSSTTIYLKDATGEPRAYLSCRGRLVISEKLEAHIFPEYLCPLL